MAACDVMGDLMGLCDSQKQAELICLTGQRIPSLAIEEAAGRIKEFGSEDLKQELDGLRALEGMFLETVKNIARASDGTARELLNDIEQHARNTGTAVGTTAKTAVEKLSGELEKNVRENITAGTDTAMKVGKQLSQAAAGFLEGIAETLKKTGSTEKEK